MVKTELKTKKERKKTLEFPVLMESVHNKGRVVLFTSETSGTIIQERPDVPMYTVGDCGDNWIDALDDKYWEVFKGEINLYNEQEG